MLSCAVYSLECRTVAFQQLTTGQIGRFVTVDNHGTGILRFVGQTGSSTLCVHANASDS
jgi:hypothetical protein